MILAEKIQDELGASVVQESLEVLKKKKDEGILKGHESQTKGATNDLEQFEWQRKQHSVRSQSKYKINTCWFTLI